MQWDNPGLWLDIAQTVAVVVLWLRKPGEDAKSELATLREGTKRAQGELASRVGIVEERLRHMPTTEQLRELEAELSGIKARLEGLDDVAKTTRNTVQRIEDFLRENR